MDKIPNLDEEDINRVLELAEKEPDAEIPVSFLEYLKENKNEIGIDLSVDLISTAIEQSGVGVIKLGGLINIVTGIPGPAGNNSFVLVNSRTTKLASKIIRHGRILQGVGVTVGYGFAVAGFSWECMTILYITIKQLEKQLLITQHHWE